MNQPLRLQPDVSFTIPLELWSGPDPEARADPVERPTVSLVTRLAPLLAAVLGYFAAFTAGRGSNALGGVLLFCAFVALVSFGVSLVSFARGWFAYRAAEAQR